MPAAELLEGVTFSYRPKDAAAKVDAALTWFAYRSGEPVPKLGRWEQLGFQRRSDLSRAFSAGDPGPVRRWLRTSGTSGRPLLFPFSLADEAQAEHTVELVHSVLPPMHGHTAVIGVPSDTSASGFHAARQLGQIGVAVVHTGIGSPGQLLRDMEISGADILLTLPRVASRLAELSNKLYERVPELTYLMLGGDVAAVARMRRLEATYRCRAFDGLGMTEVYGPAAVQVAPGIQQWCVPETLIEVLDLRTHEAVPQGSAGVLVITSLWQKAMPLRRYWTGDVVRVLEPGPLGEFRFAIVGRPLSRLPDVEPYVYLGEIDQVIEAEAWTSSEWEVDRDPDGRFGVTIEAATAGVDEIETLRAKLQTLGEWDFRLEILPPGSLSRAHAKMQANI